MIPFIKTKTIALSLMVLLCFFLPSMILAASAKDPERSVTVGEYCQFLNTVAVDDAHGLYDENQAGGTRLEGDNGKQTGSKLISRSGAPGCYSYDVVAEDQEEPISFINQVDARRYCNWLQNSCNSSDQDLEMTEYGAYELQGDQLISTNLDRTCFILKEESKEILTSIDALLKLNRSGLHIQNTSAVAGLAQKRSGDDSKDTVWKKLLEGTTFFGGLLTGGELTDDGIEDGREEAIEEDVHHSLEYLADCHETPSSAIIATMLKINNMAPNPLEPFEIAIKNNPQAERLLVHEEEGSLSVRAPSLFYENPIEFLFNWSSTKTKDQETGEALREGLKKKFGSTVADITCPPTHVENAAPWSAHKIAQVIKVSHDIHEHPFMKEAIAAQQATEQATTPAEIASAAAARSRVLLAVAQYAKPAMEYAAETGSIGSSLSCGVRYALVARSEEDVIIKHLAMPVDMAFITAGALKISINEAVKLSASEKTLSENSAAATSADATPMVKLVAKILHASVDAVQAAEEARTAAEIARPLPDDKYGGFKPSLLLNDMEVARNTYLKTQSTVATFL